MSDLNDFIDFINESNGVFLGYGEISSDDEFSSKEYIQSELDDDGKLIARHFKYLYEDLLNQWLENTRYLEYVTKEYQCHDSRDNFPSNEHMILKHDMTNVDCNPFHLNEDKKEEIEHGDDAYILDDPHHYRNELYDFVIDTYNETNLCNYQTRENEYGEQTYYPEIDERYDYIERYGNFVSYYDFLEMVMNVHQNPHIQDRIFNNFMEKQVSK